MPTHISIWSSTALHLPGWHRWDATQVDGCLTENMLTYSLGRGVERSDRLTVRDLVRQVAAHEYKFESLIYGIGSQRALPTAARRGENEHGHGGCSQMIVTRKKLSRRTPAQENLTARAADEKH